MDEEEKEVQATDEVSIEEPAGMKVEWHPDDHNPVPTAHLVRTIRIYANESGRQLKVMKTADSPDCLHIYVDVV